MDARSERNAIPLVVDLDGTLIATDLLWEGLFLLIRRNLLHLLLVPYWIAVGGPCRLKNEIAARVTIDAEALPYRPELMARLKEEKAAGRHLVLATGTPEKFARAIADHLGIFDSVFCTDGVNNLTSTRKRSLLIKTYGDAAFDYAGNSRHDIAVFDAAREAIVVAPDRAAARWHRTHGGELFPSRKPSWKTILRMLRAHQWLKNTLIVVPTILNHQYLNPALLFSCFLAFVSFSAAASAIYIVNDFFDASLDRRHPTKKNRPFASGLLSVPFGLAVSACLIVISFAVAIFLPPLFMAVLAGYLVMTTAYSVAIKRMLLIDVFTLAGLYTMRILAGAAVTQIPVSFWLLAFSIFFFLSLALVKRYVELDGTEIEKGVRIAGRGYRGEDRDIIAQGGVAAAFGSAMVLALYIDGNSVRELYEYPWMIWPLAPAVLYITLRIWVLARRSEMHDDPVVFIISDWRSQIVILIGAVMLVAAGL
jgi:4-hydroxybenzoate polyprenyltransferase